MEVEVSRITRARVDLVTEHPWFGALLMRLQLVEDNNIPSFATDGTHLYYNEKFLGTLNDSELLFVLAHEICHVAFGHLWRTGSREHILWNIAADYSINEELKDCSFTPPKGALLNEKFKGWYVEQIYDYLIKHPKEIPAICVATGVFLVPADKDPDKNDPNKGQAPLTEQDWKTAVEQVTQTCDQYGNMPSSIKRLVEEVRKEPVNWRAILRNFIEKTVPHDFSWAVPNKRYLQQGIFLPGLDKENTPPIVVAVDTSGSIGNHELAVANLEINSILSDCKPEKVWVIYCDAAVNLVDEYECDDDITLTNPGGGGTAFQPVFDYVKKHDLNPSALIYFTDLCGPEPVEPDYPVLWITAEQIRTDAWFGETIRISMYD